MDNKIFFGSCGKNVHIAEKSNIKGINNLFIGNNVSIGPHALLWTIRAKICIKDKVIIGPNLSIITGDYKINSVEKYIADVSNQEKDTLDDQDVIINSDVWIGAKVTILKAATIAEGGCRVTVLIRSAEHYGIYVEVSGKKIGECFTNCELVAHKEKLL